jgi:hypothetical protein
VLMHFAGESLISNDYVFSIMAGFFILAAYLRTLILQHIFLGILYVTCVYPPNQDYSSWPHNVSTVCSVSISSQTSGPRPPNFRNNN